MVATGLFAGARRDQPNARVTDGPFIERHPIGYDWSARFPDAVLVRGFEGGAQYSAEAGGLHWLITDEGTLADLLDDTEDADLLGQLISIRAFKSEDERQATLDDVGKSPVERLDGLIARLMRDAAPAVSASADEAGRDYAREDKDLQPSFDAAMAERLPGTGYRAGISTERACDFPDHFPYVGHVDATLVAEESREASMPGNVWVELKCHPDTDTLHACAWDAVKCAVGLSQVSASSAYLIAGVPVSFWDRAALGAELFDGGQWEAAELRTRFASSFRKWERGRAQPTRVPARIQTVPVGEPAGFTVAGTPWALRAVRVTVESRPEWFDWERFTERA